MSYKKRVSIIFAFLLLSGINALSGKTKEKDDLIKQLCLASFKMEMEIAGIKPPQKMGAFTCNCFMKEINAKGKFSEAKSTCQKEASKKFNLRTIK